jgi:two-component system chemotaxis response regulator CheY
MPSVLIADDAAFMRMMLKNVLTEAGYEIVGEAENGAVAVAKHRELKPDLTTMDITMPEMDGLAALKAIRAEDPEARVIMCSAMGQKSMVVESFSAGARDFIVKPFQADRVVSAMEKALH